MPVYRVTEWDERYEVNEKGRAWKPGETKRAGPLTYIRSKVHGNSQGLGWRKLVAAAGSRKAPGVFGIFLKILEVSGDKNCEDRGFFQDDGECPLSFILGLDWRDIEFAVSVLLTIGWIEYADCNSGDSRKLPEIPQVSPQSIHINTDQNRSDPPIVPLTGDDAREPVSDSPKTTEEVNFEAARQIYPGKKRGFRVEFENFRKHHKDWRQLLDDDGLKCCTETMIARKAYSVGFWPMFQTFCNESRYEEALQQPEGRK